MYNKALLLASVFFMSTIGYATSTCETRVDKHQKATTMERVAYCLNDDPDTVEENYANLVYYGVSDKTPSEGQDQQNNKKFKQEYFNGEGVDVSRNYVNSERFPELTNEGFSSNNTPLTENEFETSTKDFPDSTLVEEEQTLPKENFDNSIENEFSKDSWEISTKEPEDDLTNTRYSLISMAEETAVNSSKKATAGQTDKLAATEQHPKQLKEPAKEDTTLTTKQGIAYRLNKPKRIMKGVPQEAESTVSQVNQDSSDLSTDLPLPPLPEDETEGKDDSDPLAGIESGN